MILKYLSTFAKAIAAGLSAGIAALSQALADDSASLGDLSDGDWVRIVGFALGAFLVVYNIPNGSAK